MVPLPCGQKSSAPSSLFPRGTRGLGLFRLGRMEVCKKGTKAVAYGNKSAAASGSETGEAIIWKTKVVEGQYQALMILSAFQATCKTRLDKEKGLQTGQK